jgi:hypothetical protein
MREGKIAQNLKISLGMEKPEQFFIELDPKFNVFKERRKRHSQNGEEVLNVEDTVKGNPIISPEESKRESIRGR